LLVFAVLFFAQKGEGWKKLWVGTLLAWAVLSFGYYLKLGWQLGDSGRLWLGKETKEEYLDRSLLNSYEPLARWTQENLPENARLLIVGDSRGAYYQKPFFAQSVFDEPVLAGAARRAKDAKGILKALRELGVTHIVVNTPEGLRTSKEYHLYELSPEEWKRLNNFIRTGLKPVYWKAFQGVYEVKEQLSEPAQAAPVNPFSFFAPQAYDFIHDFQAKNFIQAQGELDDLLKLFPGDSYWLNQKALLLKAKGT
jgi:hypothetical protein